MFYDRRYRLKRLKTIVSDFISKNISLIDIAYEVNNYPEGFPIDLKESLALCQITGGRSQISYMM